MSNLPPEKALEKYNSGNGKGWGVLAENLGIKPGSKEFHASKRGHALDGNDNSKVKEKEKN